MAQTSIPIRYFGDNSEQHPAKSPQADTAKRPAKPKPAKPKPTKQKPDRQGGLCVFD
jgi:hypothetical protein